MFDREEMQRTREMAESDYRRRDVAQASDDQLRVWMRGRGEFRWLAECEMARRPTPTPE